MKRTLLILAFAIQGIVASSQVATYDEVISKKKKGTINYYIAQSGEEFKVGDTLMIGMASNANTFASLLQNAGISYYQLQSNAASSYVIIKRMKATSKTLNIYTTKPQGYVYPLIIRIEAALMTGEVVTKLITSDDALEELKYAKDKLDLGIITLEEYEIVKADLIQYIK